MSEAFTEILGTAERAAAGSVADKTALAELLGGVDLAGLGGPGDRAYLAVLLDWVGMSEQAMLALRPGGSDQRDHRAGMLNLAGMLASGHGDYQRARELFVLALSAADDGTRVRVKLLANLAALNLLAGDIEPASMWLARARTARGKAGDPATDVLLASTGFAIARARGDLAGMRAVVSGLNEATRARTAELGADHPLALSAVASLAAAEFDLASAEQSVENQERAIAVLEVIAHRLAADLGADHPHALTCLENLCVADFSLARASRSPDRASRAAGTLESVSRRTTAALGESHPQARAAAANAASARPYLQEARDPRTAAAERRSTGQAGDWDATVGQQKAGPTEYAKALGARLRAIRTQQGLSLHGVEEKSRGRWKAVVVGSYERGDRSVTVKKLAELAEFYGMPVTELLPGDPCSTLLVPSPKLVIDLERMGQLPKDKVGPLARYVATIQSQRGDYNGRVLSVRYEDLRSLAVIFDMSPADLTEELISWGVLDADARINSSEFF